MMSKTGVISYVGGLEIPRSFVMRNYYSLDGVLFQASWPISGATPESDLLKPHEAAELARVEVTQIYRWARSRGGRSWTMRPSRKCLRIVRPRFVAWLAAGGAARRP